MEELWVGQSPAAAPPPVRAVEGIVLSCVVCCIVLIALTLHLPLGRKGSGGRKPGRRESRGESRRDGAQTLRRRRCAPF